MQPRNSKKIDHSIIFPFTSEWAKVSQKKKTQIDDNEKFKQTIDYIN